MIYKLKKIKIVGYHGVYKKEIQNGQYFWINCKYKTKINTFKSDDISQTIDYKNIYNDVIFLFNANRYNLLESLTIYIAREIKKKYKCEYVSIEISKKNPMSLNNLKSVSVKYEE